MGSAFLKLAASGMKRLFLALEEIVKAVRWFTPIMHTYPDSNDVIRKLVRMNGKDSDHTQKSARALGLVPDEKETE